VKHHDERIRHLQQLEADLDRQIADAQQLQRGHKPVVGEGPPPSKTQLDRAKEQPPSPRARKRR